MALPHNPVITVENDTHIQACAFCRGFYAKFYTGELEIDECGACGAAVYEAGCPNYNCSCSYTEYFPNSREAWYMRTEYKLGHYCIEVTDFRDVAADFAPHFALVNKTAAETGKTADKVIADIVAMDDLKRLPKTEEPQDGDDTIK